jgi:hypothetical protein
MDPKVVEKLNEAAARYGRRTGNQVAVEIIETYLDFWKKLEENKRSLLDEQLASLQGRAAPLRKVGKK